MSTQTFSPARYVAVLVLLILLTCLTVGLSFVELTGTWHVIVGLSIGVCKASLVALFFMHLLDSRRTTWAVVIVSLFWVTIVLCALTFSDYTTRPAFPFVPGH
jgi:cytochrome c oxidase subunit IV